MVSLAATEHYHQHFQTNLFPPTWVRPRPRALNSRSRLWPRYCPAETGNVPVPPRFPVVFQKKNHRARGSASGTAGSSEIVLAPPKAPVQGQRHREGLGHSRRARGRRVFAHAEPCVSTPPAPSDRDKVLPSGSARLRSLDPFPFPQYCSVLPASLYP